MVTQRLQLPWLTSCCYVWWGDRLLSEVVLMYHLWVSVFPMCLNIWLVGGAQMLCDSSLNTPTHYTMRQFLGTLIYNDTLSSELYFSFNHGSEHLCTTCNNWEDLICHSTKCNPIPPCFIYVECSSPFHRLSTLMHSCTHTHTLTHTSSVQMHPSSSLFLLCLNLLIHSEQSSYSAIVYIVYSLL